MLEKVLKRERERESVCVAKACSERERERESDPAIKRLFLGKKTKLTC